MSSAARSRLTRTLLPLGLSLASPTSSSNRFGGFTCRLLRPLTSDEGSEAADAGDEVSAAARGMGLSEGVTVTGAGWGFAASLAALAAGVESPGPAACVVPSFAEFSTVMGAPHADGDPVVVPAG